MSKLKKGIWITNLVLFGIIVVLIIGLYVRQLGGTKDTMSVDLSSRNPSNSPTITPTTIPNKTPDRIPTTSPSPTEESIELIFTGDVLLSNTTLGAYHNGGLNGLIEQPLIDLLNQADVTMINQEFAFRTRGTPMKDKKYTFRSDPKHVSIFNELGIDVVSLANNHALDYGTEALLDTFTTLADANIRYVGAGKNLEEAKNVVTFEVKGKKIAYVGASRVIPVSEWNATSKRPGMLTTYDPTATCKVIEEAKANADYVIVYVHWGKEYQEVPEAYQKTMARQYIDAGADAVVGSHTHCLQGTEYYKDKPIIYSLGNFIFGQTIERTALLQLSIDPDGRISTSLYPCVSKGAKTSLVTNKEKVNAFRTYMDSISFGTRMNEDLSISW